MISTFGTLVLRPAHAGRGRECGPRHVPRSRAAEPRWRLKHDVRKHVMIQE